jgi:hypothetical protein
VVAVPHLRQTLVLVLVLAGCDYRELSVKGGEYVVYHWDVVAWAVEDEQLCGGTVKAADRFVDSIATHYGWSVGADGPTVLYFWDRELGRSMCGFSKNACGIPDRYLDGFVIFTYHPFHTHELAHSSKGGHGHPAFIDEGFASRWESGVIGADRPFATAGSFLSEAELRVQLGLPNEAVDYQSASTWWIALEFAYGSAKMAEFIAKVGTSPTSVEAALNDVFGITLAESVALAESLPAQHIEDPTCIFGGLPTLVWNEEPLVIDHGEAHCGDDDVINVVGGRASWIVALEFPANTTAVDIHVTVPEGETSEQKALTLAKCDGEFEDYEWESYGLFGVNPNNTQRYMDGRYVAGLQGVVRADGSAEFPRVVIEAAP